MMRRKPGRDYPPRSPQWAVIYCRRSRLLEAQDEIQASVPGTAGGPAARRKLRLRGAAVALACWIVLTGARANLPERLNVPACSFPTVTGYPCPSCGMTRGMVAMARGRIAVAARLQPFSVLLFSAIVVVAVFAMGEAMTGRDLLTKLRPGLWWIWAGLAGMFAGWAWVLLTGLQAGTLPIH